MVQIIEQILDPVRFKIGGGRFQIDVGTIVALSYDEDEVCCVPSDSRNPFGMVIGYQDEWGRVPILCGTAIIKTDKYEVSEMYLVGDSLYSSNDGQLTSCKRHDNSILLGHVLDPPTVQNPAMEVGWI